MLVEALVAQLADEALSMHSESACAKRCEVAPIPERMAIETSFVNRHGILTTPREQSVLEEPFSIPRFENDAPGFMNSAKLGSLRQAFICDARDQEAPEAFMIKLDSNGFGGKTELAGKQTWTETLKLPRIHGDVQVHRQQTNLSEFHGLN
jgi:hypothetical protein